MSAFLIIPSLHTLSPPHSTSSYLERGENAGGRVSRECPGMGGASVFGQLRVSLASGRGQMETQKCVRRNYRGHVAWWKQKANLKIKEGDGSWLSKISYNFLKNKLQCLQKEVKYAKTKIGRGCNDRPDSLSLFLNVSGIVISVTKNCPVLFRNCDIIWKALLLFILFFVLLLMNCQKGHKQRPKKSELCG